MSCGRGGPDNPCRGEEFLRTSRSGLTTATICAHHADELEEALDAIERRYPEMNHHPDCLCPGCIGDAS